MAFRSCSAASKERHDSATLLSQGCPIRRRHLHDDDGDGTGEPLPLQGLLMSLVPPDHAPTGPARQLIAFGRFPLTDAMTSLGLRIALQGESSEEKNISITATRDGSSQEMLFTPNRQYHSIFPATFVTMRYIDEQRLVK